MKINEVEKALSITKANIRFYEKEGLLTPGRTESGYREYSDAEIARLKEIVIYRKLGIPIQQIADILDGVITLQEALDTNIHALSEEIDKLNGSLALCRQIKNEDVKQLDIDRYWNLIHHQESLGLHFQSLASDYIDFMSPTLSWLYWIPEDAWRSPWRILKYLILWSAVFAGLNYLIEGDFIGNFFHQFFGFIVGILIWSVLFLPVYRLSKKNPSLAKTLEVLLPVGFLFLCIGLLIWAFASGFGG